MQYPLELLSTQKKKKKLRAEQKKPNIERCERDGTKKVTGFMAKRQHILM